MLISDVTVVSVPVSDQNRGQESSIPKPSASSFSATTTPCRASAGYRSPQTGATALVLVTWFETMSPGSLRGLVLASSDLAADYQRLCNLDVEFDQPPVRQPWATEAVPRDPDSNQLVLQQA